MARAIGIDIGTTSIGGVVYDLESGQVVRSETIRSQAFLDGRQEWERMQDAEKLISGAKDCVDRLLDGEEEIRSIGITGQMHGILYVDGQGGCVSPLFTWQDARGDLPEQWEDGSVETLVERIRRKSGLSVSSGYGLVTHIWLLRRNLLPEGMHTFCTISDYLGMRLTGRTRPLMHQSNAASLGFYDLEQGCFQRGLLQEYGVEPDVLPEVTKEVAVLGAYRGCTVTAAIGDNQASFLGATGGDCGTALANMGTGGQISVRSDQILTAPSVETRPFLGDSYLLVGASLCGGRAYAILEQFLRSYAAAVNGSAGPQYEVMERLAQKGLSQKDGMVVSTLFRGTREEPSLRGSITSVTEQNFTPESLVCGVLRGMASELFGMYQTICSRTDIRIRRLAVSGNGFRKNRVLREITGELFQAEVFLPDCEEEAAAGAAKSSHLASEQ